MVRGLLCVWAGSGVGSSVGSLSEARFCGQNVGGPSADSSLSASPFTTGSRPTLAMLLAALSGCPGRRPGLAEKGLGLLWLGSYFYCPSVPGISGARIGAGGEWECQARGQSTVLGSHRPGWGQP